MCLNYQSSLFPPVTYNYSTTMLICLGSHLEIINRQSGTRIVHCIWICDTDCSTAVATAAVRVKSYHDQSKRLNKQESGTEVSDQSYIFFNRSSLMTKTLCILLMSHQQDFSLNVKNGLNTLVLQIWHTYSTFN